MYMRLHMKSIVMDNGWLHIHTRSCREYCRHITYDYSRRRIQTGGERANRISSVRSVWSRLANRGRDYDAIRFSPCCRTAYAVGNTGLPAKTSLSERISAACSESHFRRNGTHVRKLARSTLSSGNVATSYKYGVQMRSPVTTSAGLCDVINVYLDAILDTILSLHCAKILLLFLQLTFTI